MIVKPLWQLPPSETKNLQHFPNKKNVAFKLPKISLKKNKGYLGQFKGYILCSPGSFLFFFASWGLWVTRFYNRSKVWKYPNLGSTQIYQAGSRVYQKHVRTFMRTLAKFGELWQTLANPQCHIHENLRDIHQSSCEGAPQSPEFR